MQNVNDISICYYFGADCAEYRVRMFGISRKICLVKVKLERMCGMMDNIIICLLLLCTMLWIYGAKYAECWVFQGKLALLKLK